MNKLTAIGLILLIFGVSCISLSFLLENTGDYSETETTITGDLQAYVGKLQEGSSFLPMGGEPTVVLIFEDGRVFQAPEEMAAAINMEIDKTYRITYDPAEPKTALKIEEAIF